MAKRNIRAARAAYPSDLTEAQWALIAPLIPAAEPGGRYRAVDMHEIVNGILYVLRSGCSWRMLPHDLPPWGTVHYSTTAASGATALGSTSTTGCAPRRAAGPAATLSPVRPSWTVSRSRRQKKGTRTRL
jgi:transposase